jgi:hypothetical protein
MVAYLDQGCPAARDGIRSGDEILRVDGHVAEQTRIFTLRRLLCEEGKKLIVVKRGNEQLNMHLSLKATGEASAAK